MFHDRLSDDHNREYKSSYGLNLLGFWCSSGGEWTSTMRNECLATTNQLAKAEKRQFGYTRTITLWGILISLVLLGAAIMLTQGQVSSHKIPESVRSASAK